MLHKVDFSTALYLGMRHSSKELPGWNKLSTGVPAALYETNSSIALGKKIAQLQGMEDGLIAPSVLHLFFDWFGLLQPGRYVIFADEHLYQTGLWGVERAAFKGTPVHFFRHQNCLSLQKLLQLHLHQSQIPIVVTDGWCPLCGTLCPAKDYLKLITPRNGLLVIDDTQAMGVLGHSRSAGMPYGFGGGGTLAHLNITGTNVICISSLAKAWGAPLAVMTGSKAHLNDFRQNSDTRVYASPPNRAVIAAGHLALLKNKTQGDSLRRRLLNRVIYFKKMLGTAGITTSGGFFPVQTIAHPHPGKLKKLFLEFQFQNIKTVLVKSHNGAPRQCLILNTNHTASDLQQAAKILILSLKH